MTRENRKSAGRPQVPPRPSPAKDDATETLPENSDTIIEQLPPGEGPNGEIIEYIRVVRRPRGEKADR